MASKPKREPSKRATDASAVETAVVTTRKLCVRASARSDEQCTLARATHSILATSKAPFQRWTCVEQEQDADKEFGAVGERDVVHDEPPPLMVSSEVRLQRYVEVVLT